MFMNRISTKKHTVTDEVSQLIARLRPYLIKMTVLPATIIKDDVEFNRHIIAPALLAISYTPLTLLRYTANFLEKFVETMFQIRNELLLVYEGRVIPVRYYWQKCTRMMRLALLEQSAVVDTTTMSHRVAED